MRKFLAQLLLLTVVFSIDSISANESVFEDVENVKKCWLKCKEEAQISGERALSFFSQQVSLDQPQIDAYNTLVKYYTRIFLDRGDYIRGEEIVGNYLARSLTPTSEEELASVYVLQGIIYFYSSRLVLAENAYAKALNVYTKTQNKGRQGIVLNNMGNVNLDRGKVAKALEHYHAAVPLLEAENLTDNLATTLNNLGIQLTIKGQFDLAGEYIERAGQLLENSSNLRKRIQVIQADINLMVYAGKFQQALDVMLQHEKRILDSNFPDLHSQYYYHLGTIQEELGQYEQAEVNFLKSGELAQQLNATISIANASMGLARLALKRNETDKASRLLRDIHDEAMQMGRIEFAEEVYNELFKALRDNGQFEEAFNTQTEFLSTYKARVKDEQENELAQYFALLETEEKRREVVELERNNAQTALALSLSESKRQNAVTLFIIIALVLLSIGLWLVQRQRIANIRAKSAADLLDKKNQLLSELTHELKTPISVIRLQIEALQYNVTSEPERTYALVYDKIENLNRLIDDVFQLSRANAHELNLHLERVDAQEFLLDLADTYEPQLEAKAMSFSIVKEVPDKLFIDVDLTRIEQVFANLVSNTLRYTDAPGTCRMTLYQDAKQFGIRFEDSAPGVSDKGLEQLFERLYREESLVNHAPNGTGLGLSIVQAFIQAHKGSITASHSELGGVCFDIKLPLSDV